MSDCKWTEGEWRVVDRTTNGVKGYEICWSDDGECVTDHVYEEADAYLMAAAKELYEALKRCRFDSLNMSLADLEFIRSAMNKARGEQQ